MTVGGWACLYFVHLLQLAEVSRSRSQSRHPLTLPHSDPFYMLYFFQSDIRLLEVAAICKIMPTDESWLFAPTFSFTTDFMMLHRRSVHLSVKLSFREHITESDSQTAWLLVWLSAPPCMESVFQRRRFKSSPILINGSLSSSYPSGSLRYNSGQWIFPRKIICLAKFIFQELIMIERNQLSSS